MLFKVIRMEASKRPCLTSFFTQCVAGPALVKNFLLILAGVDIQLFQATIGLILILAVISNTYLSKQ